MSLQYAIDDVAFDYELEPPIVATTPQRIAVQNDGFKLTSQFASRTVPLGRYTVMSDAADVATSKAFVNQKAKNDLFYTDLVAANTAQAGSTNANTIILSSGANGSIYPSTKIISGVVGTIASLQVSVVGVSHTRPSDIRCGLSGPDGTKTFIFTKCGGSNVISGVNLLFADSAAAPLNAGTITPGTYQCSDPFGEVAVNNPFWVFTTTAPGGLWNVLNLAQFIGKSPNGTWNLWTLSDTPGDTGSIVSFDLIMTLNEPVPQIIT